MRYRGKLKQVAVDGELRSNEPQYYVMLDIFMIYLIVGTFGVSSSYFLSVGRGKNSSDSSYVFSFVIHIVTNPTYTRIRITKPI